MGTSGQLPEIFLDFHAEKELRYGDYTLKNAHAQSLWSKFCATLDQYELLDVNKAKNFAENLDYVHDGLKSNDYFLHPLRIGATAGLASRSKSVLHCTVGLLHNVFEVTSVTQVEISNTFGNIASDAILKLTINRRLQSNYSYLNGYYTGLKNLPFNLGIIKVLDKIDNLYSLNSTADLTQKIRYIDEVKNYVIPLCNKVSPQLSDTLKSVLIQIESN